MKILKQTFTILIFALMANLTSCQEKYPDLEDGIYAEFVTAQGIMVAKLHIDKTPVTVANFVSLAEGTNTMVDSIYKNKPYYNGLTFHRVMNDFMIQGGDPLASGQGGPGYIFNDEFHADLKHNKPGILSMANPGPNSNGSQFFITEKETPWLDNRHSVFGELVLGIEILDTITNVPVSTDQQSLHKPLEDVVMNQVNIIRKGADAKAFDANEVFKNHFVELEKLKKEQEEKLESAKEAFIKSNEDLKGRVKKLPTGVVMIFTEEGEGVKPSSADNVLIDYAGYLEDGSLFDTSWADIAKEFGKYNEQKDEQGGYQPFPMIYNQTARLVPGFKEAMLNMNVGDKARVFIPSFLGYGERGAPPVIPPNANLIFDLKIAGIQK